MHRGARVSKELVIDFDKNHKNRLHRLKPKGTPQGLTPSLKASRLSLALNPCGCGRCPPASNDASKKQKKVDIRFLPYTIRTKCFTFFCFLLVLCGRAGTDRSLSGESTRRKSKDFQTRGLSDKASRKAHTGQAVLIVFVSSG